MILGEKAPEIKPSAWLDERQASGAPLTYIEFFHPSNKACAASLTQLKKLSDKLGAKMRVIIVTQEKEEKIADVLKPYLSTRIAVAIDSSAKIFTAYGVNYVPFGVLTDAKNRVLWIGNTLQLNEETIEKVSR